MRYPLIAIAAAIAVIINPVRAQAPPPGTYQPQWPTVPYPDPSRYRFVSPTPEDAYRQGLINRWEYEQLEGPTPQALQGPSPNGKGAGRGS
jgi:hypothetical protein